MRVVLKERLVDVVVVQGQAKGGRGTGIVEGTITGWSALTSAPLAGNDFVEESDEDGEELSDGDDAQDSGTAFISIHHKLLHGLPADHSIVFVCRVLKTQHRRTRVRI